MSVHRTSSVRVTPWLVALCVLFVFSLPAGCSSGSNPAPPDGDPDDVQTDGDNDAPDGDGDLDEEEAVEDESDGDRDDEEADEEEKEEEQTPAYVWPRCERASDTERLVDKAAYFDQVSRDRHIAPDGLFRNIYLSEELEEVSEWHHTPNTGLWSGIYIASQALRYAVTRDPEAQENARRVVAGLADLTDVTGIAGLYGRSMIKPGVPYPPVPENAPGWAHSTTEGYEGWRFNFDSSKDGQAGIMYGYALALEHFDDEDLLAEVRRLVHGAAHHLVQNGLQIIDITGEVTEHGRLFHSALDDYPGFNAMLAASWIKIGQIALDDASLEDFYYRCLMGMDDTGDCPDIEDSVVVAAFGLVDYIDSMERYLKLLLPNCKHNIDNFDMCYQAMYPLLRLESEPVLKERLREVVRQGMLFSDDPQVVDLGRTGNTFFTFAYAALTGDGPDDPLLEAAVDQAICTLRDFPSQKFQRPIPAGEQDVACTNRLNHPNSAEPIPLAEYHFDNYLWRLDFQEIVRDAVPEDRRMVFSPEDYLMAYWLGRYHGLLDEEM